MTGQTSLLKASIVYRLSLSATFGSSYIANEITLAAMRQVTRRRKRKISIAS